MQPEEIHHLIDKYLNDTATATEKETLLKWYRSQNSNDVEWISENPNEEEELKTRLYDQIQASINPVESKISKTLINWYRIAAAAVVLMVCSIGLFFYFNQTEPLITDQQLVKGPQQKKNEIVPGSNKAILTLADGSEIILNDAEKGVLAKQGNTAINKNKDGELVYESSTSNLPGGQFAAKITFNTISTQRGGQYQITLPDGTRVWLNAESVLTFPTAFTGKERKVKVEGEAYFEVTKNKAMPFVVETSGQTVEVLGTHFNINAYKDELSIKTTLVEGSVKVSNSSSMVILKPGQQASVNAGVISPISIAAVNIEEIIAWKNGYFLFKDEELASILRKVSRWYDVDIVYTGKPETLHFGGMVSRSKSIHSVLKIMELTGNIHFKIDGRRVLVMP